MKRQNGQKLPKRAETDGINVKTGRKGGSLPGMIPKRNREGGHHSSPHSSTNSGENRDHSSPRYSRPNQGEQGPLFASFSPQNRENRDHSSPRYCLKTREKRGHFAHHSPKTGGIAQGMTGVTVIYPGWYRCYRCDGGIPRVGR